MQEKQSFGKEGSQLQPVQLIAIDSSKFCDSKKKERVTLPVKTHNRDEGLEEHFECRAPLR
jgi:hypothetical protein